jgi:hypothetical protein
MIKTKFHWIGPRKMSDDDEGLPGVIVVNRPACAPHSLESIQLQFCKKSPIIVQDGQPTLLYLPFAVSGCKSKNLEEQNQG